MIRPKIKFEDYFGSIAKVGCILKEITIFV